MIKQNHTSKALSEILHDCLRGSFSISLLQWRLFSPHEGRNKTTYLAFFSVLGLTFISMVYKACPTAVQNKGVERGAVNICLPLYFDGY